MEVKSNIISLWKTQISNPPNNSPLEVFEREGTILKVSANITGNNDSYNTSVFKITGTVRVLDQYAEVTDATDLTNMTNIYSDLWDGTVAIDLTADGIALSNAPVGTYFTKDKASTDTYSLNLADQCRMNEVVLARNAGKPFTVTQKANTDTFIRFNYTTNTTLDMTMDIFFIYYLINGATLELA